MSNLLMFLDQPTSPFLEGDASSLLPFLQNDLIDARRPTSMDTNLPIDNNTCYSDLHKVWQFEVSKAMHHMAMHGKCTMQMLHLLKSKIQHLAQTIERFENLIEDNFTQFQKTGSVGNKKVAKLAQIEND